MEGMNWKQAREAFQAAEQTMHAADVIADDMARMLVGRLRKVRSKHILDRLKKELSKYNMKTKTWNK
jgi:hypothetical protein